MGLYDSLWTEPSAEHLAELMRQVWQSPSEVIKQRTTLARNVILSRFTWNMVADRLILAVKALDQKPLFNPNPRIAWVSTWNTKCGIATYSKYLVSPLDLSRVFILANRTNELTDKDEANVFRCWDMGWQDQLDDIYALTGHSLSVALVINLTSVFLNLSF